MKKKEFENYLYLNGIRFIEDLFSENTICINMSDITECSKMSEVMQKVDGRTFDTVFTGDEVDDENWQLCMVAEIVF